MDRAAARRGRPPHPGAAARRTAPRSRCCPRRGTCAAGSSSTAASPGPGRHARRAGRWWCSSHFADQRLYALRAGRAGRAAPAHPGVAGRRRTALGRTRSCVPERGEVWCVLEEFTGDGPTDVRRVLAAVPLDGSAAEDRDAVRELTDERHRFVTGPRLSPDGRRAAWIAWDHPRMPWDGTELIVAEVAADGTLRRGPHRRRRPRRVGRPGRVGPRRLPAVRQRPHRLVELYVRPATADARTSVRAARRSSAGRCGRSGQRWFAPLDERADRRRARAGRHRARHPRPGDRRGRRRRRTLDRVRPPPSPCTAAGSSASAASPRSAYEVVELDTRTGRARVIGAAHDDPVDPAYYPEPADPHLHRPRRPRDPRAHLPAAQPRPRRRPAANCRRTSIWAHGGPTSRAPARPRPGDRLLHLARHRRRRGQLRRLHRATGGSTATGCASSGASSTSRTARPSPLALADEGTADRARLAIRGGSAGGWTDRRLPHHHRRLRLRHDPLPDPRPRRLGAGGDPRLRVAVPGDR